jgi:predicted PurR-regulated permease PerM
MRFASIWNASDHLNLTPMNPTSDRMRMIAWLLAAAALFLVLELHLLPALLAGLLVHELVHLIAPALERRISSARGKLLAVALVAVTVVGATAVAVFGALAFFRSDAGSLASLFGKMAQIIEDARASLPPWMLQNLPEAGESAAGELHTATVDWLRLHAAELRAIGKEAGLALAHILVGMIIGAMVATREALDGDALGPLAAALAERAQRIADAFRRIVFAQVRISLLNTVFTAVYLAVALPLFGVHLPLTKTLIAVTFVAGMLPVIGNLISNGVIVIVSLAHSPQVAVASLVFLVVVHKLEYFLNARIVGSQIKASAWELLTAMLLMEAVFGLPGVVAAPIVYAWVKDELMSVGLV